MALFTKDSIDRVRDAVDMVDLVGHEDRPAPGGHALDRAVPVPRRAHAVVLGQRRGEALLLLRLRRGRRRLRVRPADRGARLPRGGRVAGRAATNVRARAGGRGPAAEERRRRRERLLDAARARERASTRAYSGSRQEAAPAREYLACRGLAEEVLREFRVGYSPSAWDRVIAGRAADGFSEQELVAAGLAQRGARAAASTTASAGGSCSRWRTRAGGCSASAHARWARAAGRST